MVDQRKPAGRKGRIPHVQQLTANDCGAACLAMVLSYYGREVRLQELRLLLASGRDGSDAGSILDAAVCLGLRGRGIHIDIEDLDYLPTGAILHWEFKHFVVFETATAKGVTLVDPAFGRQEIPMEKFRRCFTGVALLLEPGESFQTSRGEPKRAWRYMKRILAQSTVLSRIIVTSILLQLFSLALPILTGVLVDRVVPQGDYDLLSVLGAGLLVILAFRLLATFVRARLLLALQTNLDAQMTFDFIGHLVDLPYSFFQQRSAGDLLMRLNSNSTVREILTSSTLSGLLDGALVSLYLILLFTASPSMATVALVLAVIRIVIFLITRRRFRELNSASLQAQAAAQSYQVEMLAGIETLKSSGVEHRAVNHWGNLFVDVLNLSVTRGRLSATIESITDAVGMASPLIILGYGAVQVLDGRLTLGTMLAVSALASGFLGPLSTLVSGAIKLQLLGSYLERINDVFDTPPEQARESVGMADRLRGSITLEQVTFRYGPQAPAAVDEVSLEIMPGQVVAIVGRSGSGKSTLARLLLGLSRPDSGRILYDSADLMRLEARSVRRQMGIVTQQPYLFGTSIRANIALADPELPLDRVVEAAKLACIHDDIAAMPMGYDTIMVDGGASLSAGQRQRIAIARALVHQPAILLLDEATSALDTVTESEVQKNLATLPCTRIVIAHRLSTIVDSDLILVMERGAVIESGCHATLVGRNGKYAELVAGQLRN